MQLKPFVVRVRNPIVLACASIPILLWNSGNIGAQETAQVQPVVKPGDNLKIEGIPSIPVSLADKVRKYTEARAAAVLDWHPTERSMLISTRFANSNQVHRVASPSGARYQLTFFNEPVAPLNNSGKISKPLFVVQGGNDPRVPLSEAEQMVARVKSNEKPVWYLMASDEGHGFRKKNNADFQFYATVLFIEKYLLGK